MRSSALWVGGILPFKLDVYFLRILAFSYLTWRKQKDQHCQFGFSFYWVCPLDQGYKYTSGSMLFSDSQAEGICSFVFWTPGHHSFSKREIGLMVFPRGSPFLAHFPCCTLLLHPFLSKENIVSFLHMCWSCVIHISYELLF